MKNKIALVTSTYNNIYSGVGTYSQKLSNLLIEKGFHVCIISPDCESNQHFIKVQKPLFSISPNGWFELAMRYGKVLNKLDNISVVHIIDAREGLFLKRKKGVFYIGSVHDTYSFDLQTKSILEPYFLDWKKRFLYYSLLYKLEKIAYRRFDLLITNTDYVRDRLINFYDVPDKKIKTIYLPSPMDINVNEIIEEVKPPYKIAFIGGNFQRKGLLQLVRAVQLLKNKGLEIKIFVAGKDQNQALIEKWIEKNRYKGLVNFCGHLSRKEIERLLSESSVFAMPSITEAFGLVYLEAMAFGIPVIGSKEGGTKELIKDGVNGFLCNPFDIQEIAAKIELCLDKYIRKKIIKNAFETVKTFNEYKFLKEMNEIYDSLR